MPTQTIQADYGLIGRAERDREGLGLGLDQVFGLVRPTRGERLGRTRNQLELAFPPLNPPGRLGHFEMVARTSSFQTDPLPTAPEAKGGCTLGQRRLSIVRAPPGETRSLLLQKLLSRPSPLDSHDLAPMTMSHPTGEHPVLHMPAPRAAIRHAVPVLLEAVIGPITVFYIALVVTGLRGALIAALCWSYGACLRRVLRRERISTLLILDLALLTTRTTVAYLTGSTMLYFIQPMAWSVFVALVLIGSAIARRPFTQRFAQDFCSLDPAVLARPRVQRFFIQVSLLWAGMLLANSGIVLWLLLTSSLKTFVLERTGVAWFLTAAAITCSIVGFTMTMRRDGVRVQWGTRAVAS